MLASILLNLPFAGPRKIKWRNRYGVFDSYEEAIARFPQTEPQVVVVAVPITNQRPSDDEAFLFILAHI